MNVTRIRWRDAIASAAFPTDMRILRGTLLTIWPFMTSDGVIDGKDKIGVIVAETGLPTRTLQRHLTTAVTTGWLARERPGGNGRSARYQATVPEPELPATSGTQLAELHATHSYPTSQSWMPPGGTLNKTRASVSEHGALEQDRQRRHDHNDTGGPPEHGETNSSSDENTQVGDAACSAAG